MGETRFESRFQLFPLSKRKRGVFSSFYSIFCKKNRGSDPGSRVPGSVCFSSYWFRTPGLVGKGWARMNQGGIGSDDSLFKIGGWSRKVWFGGQ